MNIRRHIAPERCYWSLLTAPTERGEQAVAFAFERDLPQPVERVHIASVPVDADRLLLCGVPHETLRNMREEGDLPADCWSLTPAGLPGFLREAGLDPAICEKLELRHGPWASPDRRRSAGRLAIAAGLMMILIVGLVLIGVERRIALFHSAANEHQQQAFAMLREAFPETTPHLTQLQAQLTMALRVQEQRRQAAATEEGADPTPVVQAICRHWPATVDVEIDSLTCTDERGVLRGRVHNLAQAEALHEALADLLLPDGRWRAEALQANRDGDRVAFVISLRPQTERQP